MSTAFPVRRVLVRSVRGLEGPKLRPGSFWITGNILFRHKLTGREAIEIKSAWAKAVDEAGKEYLLWLTNSIGEETLVVQAFDSCYCFEINPSEPSTI